MYSPTLIYKNHLERIIEIWYFQAQAPADHWLEIMFSVLDDWEILLGQKFVFISLNIF